MAEFVADYLTLLIDPFVNPAKRVFLGYLLSALAIALAVQMVLARQTLALALRKLFSREIWLSRSARADYLLLMINQVVMMGAAPRLLTNLAFATFLFETLHVWFDGRPQLAAPAWAIGFGFTAALFLVDDLSKYLVHRAMHRWPFLWAFHEVHHSAETLTPLTVYRTHPVEGVLFALRAALAQGLVLAPFVFFFGGGVALMTILGANAFLFFFNLAGANLRHSHIWISYGPWLERWLISPAQHQIHHSIETRHYDRNFGAVLAVWDRWGGSLCLARGNRPAAFGAVDAGPAPHRLWALYMAPIQKSARSLARSLGRAPRRSIQLMTPVFAKTRAWLGALILGAAVLYAVAGPARAGELNIYSHRQPFLIQPFLDAYAEKTGVKINVVFASKGLAQRLLAEGENSPADVVLTVDIARLYAYVDKGLLAPVASAVLAERIPAHLRDPENRWFAFSKRARIIAASTAIEDADQITRYEDLTDPRWRGRICSRPGSHVYNRALIASVIHTAGSEAAEDWAAGVVDNLARRPQGNDRAQVKAIFEGVCDVAIINNYYVGKLKTSDKAEHRDWAAAIRVIFPNQSDRGAHVNISGGGVAKHSKNPEEAVRFLEFLTSPEAQQLYSEINFEYPVAADAPLTGALAEWGAFREDETPMSAIAGLAREAQMIIDRVGW